MSDFEPYQFFPILLLFLFSSVEKDLGDVPMADEFRAFKAVPEYVLNPTHEREDYFEAYDRTMELWDVAYQDLYVNTSKGIAHVVVAGPPNGEPVILLNGMSASATMWYPNAKALAKDFRIFGIDLIIEPGKSYKTEDIRNIKEINQWYHEVFEALHLKSYHLIGTSRGGWLATNLALQYPQQTQSLVLLGPVQTFMWIPPSTGLLKNMLNVFYPKDKRAIRTMETLSKDISKIDASYIHQYQLALKNDSLNKFVPQMQPFPKKKLKRLSMPVLVLIGDDDIFNTKRTIRKAERIIPHAEGEILEDSGHFITIDRRDLVNQKMVSFLTKVSGTKKG